MTQRTKIYLDSVLGFGKHKGKTLALVRKCEASYIQWCEKNLTNVQFIYKLKPSNRHKPNTPTQSDKSWKNVPYEVLKRWANPGYAMKPQDISCYIDFN